MKNSNIEAFPRAINKEISRRRDAAMFIRIELLFRAATKQIVRQIALKTAHSSARPPMRGIIAGLRTVGLPSPFGIFPIEGRLSS